MQRPFEPGWLLAFRGPLVTAGCGVSALFEVARRRDGAPWLAQESPHLVGAEGVDQAGADVVTMRCGLAIAGECCEVSVVRMVWSVRTFRPIRWPGR